MPINNEFVVDHIKRMLGAPIVTVEVSDANILKNVVTAVTFAAPYSGMTSLVQVSSLNSQDLSLLGVEEVVHVFESPGTGSDFVGATSEETLATFFPGVVYAGNSLRDFSGIERALETYRSSQLQSSRTVSFRFENPFLYLSGFSAPFVTIECIKEKTDVSELSPELVSWAMNYALALTQLSIGHARRKFNLSSAPINSDGESMVSDAQSAISELQQRLLQGDIGLWTVF